VLRQASVAPSPAIASARASRDSAGQASVELVALLPLLAAIAFGAMQVLSAGAAREAADASAEAGAVAILQDSDARAAARHALPAWARPRASIVLKGRRVRVRVRPRGPVRVLTGMLAATAAADAGPAPGGGR
jgi:hypothetical protein